MELYVVTDTDNLYEDRVGSLIWQDRTRIRLDLGDDKILFDKCEVERII
jgi:hypothetical protein